jgi:hypothetical protein
MPRKHSLKVFISYASGDRAEAQKLHTYLVSQGVDPWIDTENLLPGQDWKMEIARVLDDTNLIILCLSRKSVSREGYVQKEMRLALDRALEIPPGEIFLIPARLEEVDLPYSLRDFQAVDLYTENGMKKLLKSLDLRAEKVGAASLSSAESRVPKIKRTPSEEKPSKKSTSNVEIHIHGNMTGSNIILGNDNSTINRSEEK